jgi:hypothetical protein
MGHVCGVSRRGIQEDEIDEAMSEQAVMAFDGQKSVQWAFKSGSAREALLDVTKGKVHVQISGPVVLET